MLSKTRRKRSSERLASESSSSTVLKPDDEEAGSRSRSVGEDRVGASVARCSRPPKRQSPAATNASRAITPKPIGMYPEAQDANNVAGRLHPSPALSKYSRSEPTI